MKKKRFLALLLVLVMLVSTLVMGGCGTSSGNNADNGNNYDGQLVEFRLKSNTPLSVSTPV